MDQLAVGAGNPAVLLCAERLDVEVDGGRSIIDDEVGDTPGWTSIAMSGLLEELIFPCGLRVRLAERTELIAPPPMQPPGTDKEKVRVRDGAGRHPTRFWQHSGVFGQGVLMRPRPAVLDPLIVGVLAAAVSLIGAGRPSFWYDEAATISASYSRSLGQLWQMLSNVDAVHGLYYLLMHGWFTVFPPTEFWSRVPSGLAVGGAAAGVVVLGKQFSSRTVAVSSGVICAILPRATWAGIEARPMPFR